VLGTEDADVRRTVLEVYARRFYRIRELRDLRFDERSGDILCVSDYDWENKHIHLVVAYTALERLPDVARAVAAHLRHEPTDRQIVVDLATWKTAAYVPVEQLAPQVQELLVDCNFGRDPWRLDVTVTSTEREQPEHFRTVHLSYRPAVDGGLREDRLYRNLHPMLAKRLNLWRLSNFRLERLASAEDVYLFYGVAHENPKDHRLFAPPSYATSPGCRAPQAPSPTPGWSGSACRLWRRCEPPW
jgi:hypothetical protein